jgi:hypothetical protein
LDYNSIKEREMSKDKFIRFDGKETSGDFMPHVKLAIHFGGDYYQDYFDKSLFIHVKTQNKIKLSKETIESCKEKLHKQLDELF